ncbi:MAG: hypothetical protein CL920_02140 [Deltaproteobacteria bacterium]|nr:hypothetical protein [Deltaproteobacteria bacterium]MBU47478.1 hypothetical protein [Deltaproteobacteria bacterium]
MRRRQKVVAEATGLAIAPSAALLSSLFSIRQPYNKANTHYRHGAMFVRESPPKKCIFPYSSASYRQASSYL